MFPRGDASGEPDGHREVACRRSEAALSGPGGRRTRAGTRTTPPSRSGRAAGAAEQKVEPRSGSQPMAAGRKSNRIPYGGPPTPGPRGPGGAPGQGRHSRRRKWDASAGPAPAANASSTGTQPVGARAGLPAGARRRRGPYGCLTARRRPGPGRRRAGRALRRRDAGHSDRRAPARSAPPRRHVHRSPSRAVRPHPRPDDQAARWLRWGGYGPLLLTSLGPGRHPFSSSPYTYTCTTGTDRHE
ncbi:hypothetical protein EES45_00095 [Streptomyces sp. ADI97-07]|nr:hypothetical protein EES45_00095 [Streptomyces sp. ADI97-07]